MIRSYCTWISQIIFINYIFLHPLLYGEQNQPFQCSLVYIHWNGIISVLTKFWLHWKRSFWQLPRSDENLVNMTSLISISWYWDWIVCIWILIDNHILHVLSGNIDIIFSFGHSVITHLPWWWQMRLAPEGTWGVEVLMSGPISL